jgi:hypothetical protein
MPRTLPACLATAVLAQVAACGPGAAANVAAVPGQPPAAADPYASGARCVATNGHGPVESDPYPERYRAVFPVYPNARPIPCLHGIYEFRTADDVATVVAWYKGHSTVDWFDRQGGASGGRGDVAIFIDPPPRPINGVNTVIIVGAQMPAPGD